MAIWRFVVAYFAAHGWRRVRPVELAAMLAEAVAVVDRPPPPNSPPDWPWRVGRGIALLHRVIAGDRTITGIEITALIRLHLDSADMRIERLDPGRFVAVRGAWLDILARLLVDVRPTEWERRLLAWPERSATLETPAGERIRAARAAAGWSQGRLAVELTVDRSSVARSGGRRPGAALRPRRRARPDPRRPARRLRHPPPRSR